MFSDCVWSTCVSFSGVRRMEIFYAFFDLICIEWVTFSIKSKSLRDSRSFWNNVEFFASLERRHWRTPSLIEPYEMSKFWNTGQRCHCHIRNNGIIELLFCVLHAPRESSPGHCQATVPLTISWFHVIHLLFPTVWVIMILLIPTLYSMTSHSVVDLWSIGHFSEQCKEFWILYYQHCGYS